MADIEKIKVGGTSYDVRDALAAHALSDIAIAGDNITFENGPFTDYTATGALTINDEYVVSGFSDSNYLSIQNPLYGSGSRTFYELVIAFMVSSVSSGAGLFDALSADSRLTILESSSNDNAGYIRFRTKDIDIKSANVLQFNQKYWVKITYDSTSGYKILLSTDGVVWNEEATSTNTASSIALNSVYIGRNVAKGWPLNGSVYLQDTYVNVNNGEFVWRPVYGIGISKINATVPSITVDQTYNASSANAQSGVAINGAGFLKNTATGSNSLTILGSGGNINSGSINIGPGSNINNGTGCTALGYNAQTRNNYGVAVGYEAYASGNAVCIGYPTVTINGRKGATNSNTIAIGQSTVGSSDSIAIGVATVYGSSSIAIGRATTGSGANYAIQLGYGSNNTSNTFSVGLSTSNNYRLLNSDGTIPGERMALQGTEAPTTSTAGSIGQFYVDTTNQIGYICVSAADSTYVWKQITA